MHSVVKPGNHGYSVKQLQLLLRAAAIEQKKNGNKTLVQTVPGIENWGWVDGSWGLNAAKSATTIALHKFQDICHIPITDRVEIGEALLGGVLQRLHSENGSLTVSHCQ
jgi:hypothetical protein